MVFLVGGSERSVGAVVVRAVEGSVSGSGEERLREGEGGEVRWVRAEITSAMALAVVKDQIEEHV